MQNAIVHIAERKFCNNTNIIAYEICLSSACQCSGIYQLRWYSCSCVAEVPPSVVSKCVSNGSHCMA